MATEILRPNASGDECAIPDEVGCSACPNHYDCVDEASADDTTTKIRTGTIGTAYRDLYNLPAHSGTGIINKITVHFRVFRGTNCTGWAKASIKTGGSTFDGTETAVDNSWTSQSHEWADNPDTSNAWTWNEIDALQIGVQLKLVTMTDTNKTVQCTQVYVEIDYTPPVVVTPTTLALTITTYAPTVSTPRLVTPTTLVLLLTTYTPTALTPILVTPSTLALILTAYAPTVLIPLSAIVRIAFDTDPLAITPTWTEVTADVLSIYTKRGRQHELGRMETGIATIQLLNVDGNYWPLNAGGDYYGKVLPGKKINIRASFNGIIYDLYTGFIESWEPDWLDRKIAIITVRCTDIGKRFSRFDLNNAGEAQELSGVRADNVLDEIGWPAADRDLDAGQTTLKATGPQVAVNAMTHLFLVQDTEVGIIFLAPDGDIQFQDRHARLKAPYTVSQATFGDDTGEEGYRFLKPSYDDQFIYNDIRRTRVDGAEQMASDATSQDDYGKSTSNKTGLLMLLDTEAQDQCDYMLSQYKDPHFRIKEIDLMPDIDPDTLFPIVLSYDISTRITLRYNDASLDEDFHIEGIIHNYDKRKGLWNTKWQLSNASGAVYWAIGVVGFSEIGETTKVAY